ncbi:MAG: FMN-binding negative transcriptional regulator [Ilumatobacteraceae bacterium]
MFMPRHFEESDRAVAVAMARVAGFGHLVVTGNNGIESTPMPFLIDDDATVLRGHVARPNPIVGAAPCDALFVIPVSDAYVSPGWYPSKAEHGRVVPTWNYEVVHLHGRLAVHDEQWTDRMVRDLTAEHEAGMPSPWSVDDAPADYVAGLLRAIVGVSLEVTRVVAKRKLSQNKSSADLAGATDGLFTSGQRGASDVADAMHAQAPPER